MSIWVVALFILGFVLIIKGGDWFVEAAVWIAEVTHIPKILIGATIVSLATTLPELFVSLFAVLDGSVGLGIGNAIGSIICNTGLILSIALMASPPKIRKKIVLTKGALLFAAVATLTVTAWNGTIAPVEGLYLFAILALFILYNVQSVKRSKLETEDEILEDQKEIRHIDTDKRNIIINILKFGFGAGAIILGANLLVNNGVIIASFLGISETVIGLTVVALGTSLPELVTTITSLVKKHGEMGVGNILGANILNIVLVLGTCAVSSKSGLVLPNETSALALFSKPRTLSFDIPIVMLMLAILLLPLLLGKPGKLRRWQGFALIGVYALYILSVIVL
ncbi:MAG: calcium/sodium antiporter [Eubacteriales bacterium]